MQIKIFTVPILGGEEMEDSLNAFLRSRRVLQTEKRFVENGDRSFWCFCVQYLDGEGRVKDKKPGIRVDYKEVLDEETFKKFSTLRIIRKRVANDDGVPAFAVFTDKELAGIAALENITPQTMRSVKGIGEKKVEKYAKFFMAGGDEKS